MKALVVDDSRAMRAILKRILLKAGFEVEEAGHALDALNILRSTDMPDICLVDWNMPEMNGYELIRLIRTKENFNPMMIMMVTTEAEQSQMLKALEAGANEYVMKPFTEDTILNKIEMLGIVPPPVQTQGYA